ncbi:LysE family translocator [Halomonas sp. PR-M31]|uniref:LysE family translocator n=1 Tax=Halomonas sp. PR-M31 TaxID=1471202 RepID=UPI0006516918|nr:LysE family transporter [Halomonas sp. PR-M31]
MSLVEILALFAAMAALALVPSTSVALVVARSCSAGFSNGSAVVVGIVAGDLVFVFLAVLGMAALAEVVGSFFSGLLLTLGDVKAIFFYASLFPAFVNLATIGTLDIAIIAVITIVAVGGVKLGYAYFAGGVASFATNYRAERAVKVTAGGLMVGAGSYLIAKA